MADGCEHCMGWNWRGGSVHASECPNFVKMTKPVCESCGASEDVSDFHGSLLCGDCLTQMVYAYEEQGESVDG